MEAEPGQLRPEQSRQPGTIGGSGDACRDAGQLQPWTDSAGRLEQSRGRKKPGQKPGGISYKGIKRKTQTG